MSSLDFTTIANIIKQRRSVFPPSFLRKAIPRELLIEILDCANAAPTHKLTQPWRFTVFRENGALVLADRLATLYREHTPAPQFLQKKYENTREKVLQSGAVIAIVVRYSGTLPQWEEMAATACAVENLWLAASAAGIGGYWSTPGAIHHMADLLQLDDNEACLGFFYMGYHAEPIRTANRIPIIDKINWVE